MGFVKAKKSQAKARVALTGPTGAGKTYSALVMATGMAKKIGLDATIVVLDTEHNSAAKYSDQFDFMVPETPLADHAPATYVKAIEECEAAGFDIIVIDSLSHAWMGRGGALEMKDRFAARSKSNNTFQAWAKVTPEHNRLMEKLISSQAHIIATMRSKMSYVQEKDDRGRTAIRKVGMAPVQRDGVEYEFDLIGDIDRDHKMTVDKTRWSAVDAFHAVVDEDFGGRLVEWLSDGDPVVAAEPQTPSAKDQVKAMMDEAGFSAKALKTFMINIVGAPSSPKQWEEAHFQKALDAWDPTAMAEAPQKIAIN